MSPARPATERSALELARAIRARELSAREVVEAHVGLLEALAPRINAIAMDRFDSARREAEAADRRIAAAGDEPLPPLLGVPFTVKESIAVRGMPSSAGLIARREYRSPGNAPVVQRLLDAGAIALGVTNTSELTLWIESYNPLYGRTSNPYDPTRTAGGSSGGEGAAVGSGGSPIGLASDIAGSIRIPAQFNGVFGHKPSSGAVPNTGMYPPSEGPSGRMLGVGPLTRRAEDLMPVLRLIAGGDGMDPFAREIVFGDPGAVELDGMTVVTVEGSALAPLSREMRDARERAVGALIGLGARLRRVTLHSWRRAILPYLTTLQSGSSGSTSGLIVEAGASLPTWRTLIDPRVPYTLPVRIALAAGMLPEGGAAAHDRLLDEGRRLADELIEVIGDGVLLHPAHPRVAPRHGRTVGRLWLLTPAAMFNLAGCRSRRSRSGSRRPVCPSASRWRPGWGRTTSRSRSRWRSSESSVAGCRRDGESGGAPPGPRGARRAEPVGRIPTGSAATRAKTRRGPAFQVPAALPGGAHGRVGRHLQEVTSGDETQGRGESCVGGPARSGFAVLAYLLLPSKGA